MKNKGFFWHEYHNLLATYCNGYLERIKTIETSKPIGERPLRKRLFQPVKGELPKEFTAVELEYVEAGSISDPLRQRLEDISRKYEKEIEALHAKECPNCPWDGETIFPKGEKE